MHKTRHNTSATGGFLEGSPVRSGEETENIFHDLIAGITGLAPGLVRPRWQAEPPALPKKSETWCAFGITDQAHEGFPAQVHDGEGEGKTALILHGKMTLLASFYGPGAAQAAAALRAGIHMDQNRSFFKKHGLNFLYAGTVQHVPGLTQYHWLDREDLQLAFSFEEKSDFGVLNLKSAQSVLNAEGKIIRKLNTEECDGK